MFQTLRSPPFVLPHMSMQAAETRFVVTDVVIAA